MILSDIDIQKAIQSSQLEIRNGSNQFEPASYDMQVGDMGITKSGVVEISMEHPFTVARGETAVIYPKEEISLGLTLCARFGLTSKFARKGLLLLSGPQIDPGFSGKLEVTVFNCGAHPVVLSHGEAFVTIEFEKLQTPASRAYHGIYQKRPPASSDMVETIQNRTKTFAEYEEEMAELRSRYNFIAVLTAIVFAAILAGIALAIMQKLLGL